MGSAVSAMCQFTVVMTVARLYSAADAGRFFAITAVFLIMLAVVQLGADQGVVRFVAWHLARGDARHARQVLLLSAVPVAVASVTGAAVVNILLAAPVAGLVSSGSGPDSAAMLRILALLLPVAAIYEVLLAATCGFGTMRPTVVVERLVRPLLQAVAILAVALAGLDTEALAWAWSLPYLLALGFATYALRRIMRAPSARPVPPRATGEVKPAASRRSVGLEFWAFTSPRAVSRICQVLLQRFDIILVAALVGPEAAAVYTAATRFIALGQLANQAIGQVIAPQLAAMLARDARAEAEALLQRGTQWLVALAWPGYLALIGLAPWLMGIFGPGYAAGTSSLVVLAVAMLVATAAGPVDVALLMGGRSTVSLLIMIVAIAVDVIGLVLLVPRTGILGAAIAWAAAIVVRNVLTVWQTRRTLEMSATSRVLYELSVTALLCYAVVPVPLALAGAPLPLVVLAVGGGTALYLVLLWRRRASLGLQAVGNLLGARSRTSDPNPVG